MVHPASLVRAVCERKIARWLGLQARATMCHRETRSLSETGCRAVGSIRFPVAAVWRPTPHPAQRPWLPAAAAPSPGLQEGLGSFKAALGWPTGIPIPFDQPNGSEHDVAQAVER